MEIYNANIINRIKNKHFTYSDIYVRNTSSSAFKMIKAGIMNGVSFSQ